jgi:hypothetical protein
MGKSSCPFPALSDSLFSKFSPVPCLPGTIAPHDGLSGVAASDQCIAPSSPTGLRWPSSRQSAAALVAGDVDRALREELLLLSRVNHRNRQPGATTGLLRQAHPGIQVYTLHGALHDHQATTATAHLS